MTPHSIGIWPAVLMQLEDALALAALVIEGIIGCVIERHAPANESLKFPKSKRKRPSRFLSTAFIYAGNDLLSHTFSRAAAGRSGWERVCPPTESIQASQEEEAL